MSLDLYFDREGNPISLMEYARLSNDIDYKRIDFTTVGPFVVSTVWLGIDHQFGLDGPPLLFESMVFSADAWEINTKRGPDAERVPLTDFDCQRYSTEAEARAGHNALVALVEASLDFDANELNSEHINNEGEQK